LAAHRLAAARAAFLLALLLLHRDDWRLVHAPELRPGGGWQGAATAAWVAMNITAVAMSGSLRIVNSPQVDCRRRTMRSRPWGSEQVEGDRAAWCRQSAVWLSSVRPPLR
jgi:hypothetical protein